MDELYFQTVLAMGIFCQTRSFKMAHFSVQKASLFKFDQMCYEVSALSDFELLNTA